MSCKEKKVIAMVLLTENTRQTVPGVICDTNMSTESYPTRFNLTLLSLLSAMTSTEAHAAIQ